MTPSRQRARELDADDVRREEVDRLAEHAGFGLDAADAPADDAEAVDHRRVRVGADERVGIVDAVLLMHAAREVLEVHLVDDADAGRHDLERVERLHAPFQELVALGVALELDLHVEVERVGRAVVVDLHRVVDDEVDRHERLDDLRVRAQFGGDVAHRGEIDEQRHAGEVLQHDARDDERNLVGTRGAIGAQLASLRTCCSVTFLPSQLRSTDSSTMRIETGRREILPTPALLERRQRIESAGSARGEAQLLLRVEQIVSHRLSVIPVGVAALRAAHPSAAHGVAHVERLAVRHDHVARPLARLARADVARGEDGRRIRVCPMNGGSYVVWISVRYRYCRSSPSSTSNASCCRPCRR